MKQIQCVQKKIQDFLKECVGAGPVLKGWLYHPTPSLSAPTTTPLLGSNIPGLYEIPQSGNNIFLSLFPSPLSSYSGTSHPLPCPPLLLSPTDMVAGEAPELLLPIPARLSQIQQWWQKWAVVVVTAVGRFPSPMLASRLAGTSKRTRQVGGTHLLLLMSPADSGSPQSLARVGKRSSVTSHYHCP